MRGNQLDAERQLANFHNYELSRFYPLVPGIDILPKSFGVKNCQGCASRERTRGGKSAP